MDTARIAALLEPFLAGPLPPGMLSQISTYIDLLLRWNARVNLTSVRDPDQIVPRHFGESLFLARHLFPEDAAPAANDVAPDAPVWGAGRSPANRPRVLDIGSGAGFPGLPLKIWAPTIELTLLESNHKKAAFLREVARELRLTDVNVMTERAEAQVSRLGATFPNADVVTLRAVEHFEAVLPIATRLLAPNSRLALLVGTSQVPSLSRLAPALHWAHPIAVPNSNASVVAIGSTL